ncbi:IDEAL domain-containing protein [Pseudalkalibacillus sp. SCS-8]|uniref:IDEAL domain-containing protein n=1 Tax=Pseudalkalibacillus nanhaiensis TaxID=3115291 RepID=UPI0032D9B9B6
MNKHTSSFQAKMKEQAQQKQKRAEQFFVSLAAQLILDEAFFEHQREKLLVQIDEALARNDYKSFLELSEKYRRYQDN